MSAKIRALIPNSAVNYGWHLPKAILANLRTGFPGRKLRVIGVTGTDGKTTTSNMIYQILTQAGLKTALISTINARIGDRAYDTGFHVTSPDSMQLQQYLRQAVEAKCEFLVLEITSHALDQFRAWGVPIEIGVITNITRDHFDYHHTFENYRQAKTKLIRRARVAVINRDDPSFNWLRQQAGGQVVSFGFDADADVSIKSAGVKTNLPGDFNLLNAAAATAVGRQIGVDEKVIKRVLQHLVPIDGRMNEVKNQRRLKIVIDFAHTPNALEQALKSLRQMTKGRVIAVFGSAGSRDAGKRPMMGQIGAQFADKVIVTAEDPRGQLAQINAAIAKGLESAGAKLETDYWIVPDRAAAIDFAINQIARPGDVVGIFGKGHEASMALDGRREIPWSDKSAVQAALKHG